MKHFTYLKIAAVAAIMMAGSQIQAMWMQSAMRALSPLMRQGNIRTRYLRTQPAYNTLFSRWYSTNADAYTVLGVKRGASQKEIKNAYYERLKENHPDLRTDVAAKAQATAKTQEIIKAYKTLENNTNNDGADTQSTEPMNAQEKAMHEWFTNIFTRREEPAYSSGNPKVDESFRDRSHYETMIDGYPPHLQGDGPHYFRDARVTYSSAAAGGWGRNFYDFNDKDDSMQVRGRIRYIFRHATLNADAYTKVYLDVEVKRAKTEKDYEKMALVDELIAKEMPAIEKRREAFLQKCVEHGVMDELYNAYGKNKRPFISIPNPENDYTKNYYSMFDGFYQNYFWPMSPSSTEKQVMNDVFSKKTLEDHLYHNQCVYTYVKKNIEHEKKNLQRYEAIMRNYEADLEIYKQKQYEKMIDRTMSNRE